MHFAGLFIFYALEVSSNTDPKSFSALAAEFLLWAEVEPGFSLETVQNTESA